MGSVVPHTWLRAIPAADGTRAIRLTEPDCKAQISVAIRAGNRASVAARSFLNVAADLMLAEVFEPDSAGRGSSTSGLAVRQVKAL